MLARTARAQGWKLAVGACLTGAVLLVTGAGAAASADAGRSPGPISCASGQSPECYATAGVRWQ